MTRLPSDSFLPSGAMDADLQLSLAGLAGSPSSVISPLSLPGGVHYFDPVARPAVTSCPNQGPHINRGGSRDPPRAQPASFLSPHLTPIPSHSRYRLQIQQNSQQRASSLSPPRYPLGTRKDAAMDNIMDASEYDLSQRVTSAGVSIPVNTISGTGSGLITIRRPAVRINPTVDSVSGDSQSTEQDYRRLERMRQAFDDERRYLQANRDRAEEVYKEMVDELEQDHARQRSQWESDKYKLQTQIMQLQNRLKEAEARGNGSTADAKFATFQPGTSSQISPMGQSNLSPSVSWDRNPLDASMAMENQEPTKVIDVQEYHKDLEGIHLKENFVKMETFIDTPSSAGSKDSSGRVSPPQDTEDSKALARARSIRALQADASSRLTMHAGHTPTVSLSIAHTETTNTVVSSGSNTPTLTNGDGALSSDGNDRRESVEPAEPVPTCVDQDPAIMEPSDEDPELKGPLTLRNMPAKDELFLRRLSDKLEKVTSGEDATPTVLKHPDDEDDTDAEISTQKPNIESEGGDTEGTEDTIELRIRQTSSNFGKPFGVA